VIDKPVEVNPNLFVPKIEIANSPDAPKIPVEVSDAKFNDGAPADPLTRERLVAPAAIVDALSILTESHSKITCCPAGTTAIDPPELVVNVMVKLAPVPSV
jgi:hypothetical protein